MAEQQETGNKRPYVVLRQRTLNVVSADDVEQGIDATTTVTPTIVWVECGTVEAIKPEQAAETIAEREDEPGDFAAPPERYFHVIPVGEREPRPKYAAKR